MTDIVTRRLYGGRVTVDLNPKSHRYHVSDTKAAPDGVTTLCNGVIPKFQLIDWAGRTCAQAVRDGCLKVLEETGIMPEQTAFLAICAEAEQAHNAVRDAAGDSGSRTHDLIEQFLRNPYADKVKVPGDDDWAEPEAVTNGFNAFLEWWEHTDVEILEVERLVYSEKYFYCGKTDILGRRNGKLLIGDFKTGNSAGYESEWYQLAAYALAIEEETGDKIEEGLIVHLDKRTGRFKEYHVTIDDDMKGAWKAAVIHYKNLKRVRKLVEEKRNGT
jgi:hypothetical protein